MNSAHDDTMAAAAHRAHVEFAVRRSVYRWRYEGSCPSCGEWIGHWGGPGPNAPPGDTRPHCPRIPLDVILEEVRPNCYDVRRPRIGDAIRAAEARR